MKIRRALLSVSDKSQLVELGRALAQSGVELVATGNTAKVLEGAGLTVVPIERVSGSPEAFRGRMKTLSFNVCSGILFRRGDSDDEKDLKELGVAPIDCVVVNFYPFEKAAQKTGISRQELVEQVDIGGPTLVRAAAKNAPDVLVLTSPQQYPQVIEELQSNSGVSPEISDETSLRFASQAWERVFEYDAAIRNEFGGPTIGLRYGENPHQQARMQVDSDSPIDWPSKEGEGLTPTPLSYNNVLDFSGAYSLACDLQSQFPDSSSVVIVKHNNPCGVASVPLKSFSTEGEAQKHALLRAWEGDPVSAFGGVVVLTKPLSPETAEWLGERFVEMVAAPGLQAACLETLLKRRKKLKAVSIRRFESLQGEMMTKVPGGTLFQDSDVGLAEELQSVTDLPWPRDRADLTFFGIAVTRSLKSNAIALVREVPGEPGVFQLVGAGQGQPNRVEALKELAVPRAQRVLKSNPHATGAMSDCLMISDAFFPFRDTVDQAHTAGIKYIVQPGGSLKDRECIAACNEHGMAMVFTGRRHFRH